MEVSVILTISKGDVLLTLLAPEHSSFQHGMGAVFLNLPVHEAPPIQT